VTGHHARRCFAYLLTHSTGLTYTNPCVIELESLMKLANTTTLAVDWNRGELRPAPRADRPHRRETYYPATCGRCNGTRWLRRVDASKAEATGCVCRHCQTSDAGKLGYAATVEKYGYDFAIEAVRSYRLDHPSKPESVVASHVAGLDLAARGLVYVREFRFDGVSRRYLLDGVIRRAIDGAMLAVIEINGWHHRRPARMVRDADLLRDVPAPVLVLDAARLELTRIDELVHRVI
jgi:hypothetical protein